MSNSDTLHFLLVSEAISILRKHTILRKYKAVEHAVLDILDKCNISKTNTSRSRIRTKLLSARLKRTNAIKNGRLAIWLAEAEQE